MNCSKPFFTIEKNKLPLSRIVGISFRLYVISRGSVSIEDVYDKIVKELLEQQTFMFTYEPGVRKQAFVDSINDIKDGLIMLSRKILEANYTDFEKFLDLLSGLLQYTGIQDVEVVLQLETPAPDILGVNQDVEKERKERTLNSIVKLFYGTALGALLYRLDTFGKEFLKKTIIDTEKRTITRNNLDLNTLIALFKNDLLSNISEFLLGIYPDKQYPSKVFDDNGRVTNSYIYTLNLFYNYIKTAYKDKSALSNKVNLGWKKTLSGLRDIFFDAVNSYVNLVYFDTLIEDLVGKAVKIDDNFRDFEVGIEYGKYSFYNGGEHKIKTWGASEIRNAMNDIAKFSKLVIGLIPMKSNRNGRDLNRNVDITSFSNSVTLLFKSVALLESVYDDLKNMLFLFHANPSVYSELILKYIVLNKKSIKDILISHGLTEFDLNVLCSVYDYVFNFENIHSIKNIEVETIKKHFDIDRYSIIDSITGVMDRVMDASFLLTTYDSDGYAITEMKKKSPQRRELYSMYQNINHSNIVRSYELRKKLSERYPIKRVYSTDTSRYTININGRTYDIKSKGSMGVLGFKPYTINGSERYYKVFSRTDSTIDLLDTKVIDRILNNKVSDSDELIFRDVLKFIDTFLGTNFLTKDGLDLLQAYKTVNRDANFITTLFSSAIRVAIVNDIYRLFNEAVESGDTYKDSDFTKFVKDIYKPFESVSLKEKKDYFETDFGIDNLISISTSAEWLDPYAKAKSILNGTISKAVTKDLQGNSISNYRTSFLGGNYLYYLNKTRTKFKLMKEVDDNAILAANSLLFTNRNDLIKRVVLNNDIQARTGVKKSIRDLKPAELYYTSIFHNFFGNYLGENAKDTSDRANKAFIIQPTTYADKVSFINYAIDADSELKAKGKSYNGKSLALINTEEALDLYMDTIGKAYKDLYLSVLNDYALLFGRPVDVFEINNLLKGYSEEQLISLGRELNVNLLLDTHYRIGKNGLMFNELLYNYAQLLYATKDALRKRMKLEELNFLNDLLDSNVFFYTKYYDDVNSKNTSNPVMRAIKSGVFIDDVGRYLELWIKNNKLILAKVDGKDIIYGSRIKDYNTLELNPLLEKFLYTESLLSNNLRYSLTGSEIGHSTKKLVINWELELKNVGLKDYPPFYKDGNLDVAFISDLVNLKNYINTAEISTKVKTALNNLYDSVIRKTEALAQGTQLKRNVIIPATLLYVLLKVLNGVPSKIKVAVIRDIKAKIFNFRGDKDSEDAHDGSAWINPFISILENLSLQDLEVGVDKKPIWHHYDDKLMTATLLKFATFTMTNERMLSSLNSDLSLYNLFKQMTNQLWFEDGVWKNSRGVEIDLIKGKGFGRKNINFLLNILKNSLLFYNLNGEHYLIIDLQRNADGLYYTVEMQTDILGNPKDSNNRIKVYHLFDELSNHIRVTEDLLATIDRSKYHSINSLFELHSALGGIFSESLDEDHKLIYSEASNYAVVNYMNNISTRIGDNTSDLSLDTYYLPLKEMMISYAANNSAVKNGASNINLSDAWYGDKKLSYMELDSDGLGILMDADHEIDEAEMTEFSLVIAALEAGGRLHKSSKLVYKALGKLALIASDIEIKAVADFIKKSDDSNVPTSKVLSELYDVVGKTLINNFKRNPDLAELASDIILTISERFNVNSNHIRDEFLIPFSDPNIYSKVIPTFVSNINNKSIKRKYAGSGCVMVPGYKIILNFKIDGYNYSFTELLTRARIENNKRIELGEPPLVDSSVVTDLISYNRTLVKAYLSNLLKLKLLLSDSGRFIPTDYVNVIFNDTLGILHEVEIELDDPDTYYSFKGGNLSLAELILNNGYKDTEGNLITSIEGIEALMDKNGYIKCKESKKSKAFFLFRENVTLPRSLLPARITWSYIPKDSEGNDLKDENGNYVIKYINIFDLEPIKKSFDKNNKIVNRAEIQKAFDDLHNGVFYLNGVEYQALDILNKPAELVMSNLYATKFNTKGASLVDVLLAGPSYFLNTLKLLINSDKYELALIKGTNINTYVTFKDIQSSSGDDYSSKKINWEYIKRDNNEVYFMTKDNQKLFLIGRDIVRDDIRYDEENKVFKDKTSGTIIDNPNLIVGDDGLVLEYIEFISKYNISLKDSKGRYHNFILYKIDENNIRKVLNRSDNQSEEDFNTDVKNFISNRLKDIYMSDSYKSILLNTKIPTETALLLCRIFLSINLRMENKNYIQELGKLLLNSFSVKSPMYNIDSKAYKLLIQELNEKLAIAEYNSFKKSLTFTASRIPALTLLSFMQMELTGFTNSSKNIAYVSHWQTWLKLNNCQ